MAEEIEVKWLKEKTGHKFGDIVKVSEEMAEHLVKKGDAKYIEEPKEWKEEKYGRFIRQNEIIIEDISEENILMVAGKMEKAGYTLEYWKAPKQETGHLHIKNIQLPEDSTIVISNKYKELIIKRYLNENLWEKVDWNFYNRRENAEPHRIAIENKEHYKGYGIKTLIRTWGDKKENPLEKKIWAKAIEESAESKIPQQDVEDWNLFIEKVVPNWIEGKRQELSLSVGGYLRKEKRLGIEKVKSIITEICKKAKDNEIPMRLKGVDETFRKDEKDIKGYSGLPFLEKEKLDYKKPIIEHPKTGKLISRFAKQTSNILKNKNTLFYRPNLRSIIEIGKIKDEETGEETYLGFISVVPNRFITFLEDYCVPGVYVYNPKIKQMEFHEKSITPGLAQTLLNSQILQENLPLISRMFTIPIPILYNNKITFPKKGYDKRFNSWMNYNVPEISHPDMDLKEAKEILNNLLKEFCFKTQQDFDTAIAALITPGLKGLFKEFNTRTPVFFYLGNRERVGKDYLAGITGIVYEGQALEETPISSGERSGNNNEELRKKLTAAIKSGKKRLHFSNNKGYLNNAVFEGAITTETYSDRLLGTNETIEAPNEFDFSLSGNVGITYTPDFANRCKFINLFLDIEDANSRIFKNPTLHLWVKENRSLIFSAIYSLVRNWIDNGMKSSTISFASFPEWARVCGGIMEAAGYSNPCIPNEENIGTGDSETQEIKQLFEMCYARYSNQWIVRDDIKNLILTENKDLLGYYDFDKRSDQTKFGLKIIKYVGRIFSNIKLIVEDDKIRGSRQQYKFIKSDKQEIIGKKSVNLGNLGNLGNQCNLHTKPFQAIKKGVGEGSHSLPRLPKEIKIKSLVPFSYMVVKDGKQSNLIFKKDKIYKKEDFGDNAEQIIEILIEDGKIELKKT